MEVKFCFTTIKNAFIYSFVAYVILLMPLILSGRPYIDDLGRSVEGYRQWEEVGRPLASWMIYVLNLGDPLINVFPLYQIFAVMVLSAACSILALLFNIKNPLLAMLGTLPLGIQPYYLENLSYAFDAVTMTVGLLLAIAAAFVHLRFDGRLVFVISMTLVASSFAFYQQTATAYFLVIAFFLVREISNRAELSNYLTAIISGIVGIMVSVAASQYTSGYGVERASTWSLSEMPAGLAINVIKYWKVLLGDWSGSILWWSGVSIFVLGFGITIFRSSLRYRQVHGGVYFIISTLILLMLTLFSMGLPLLLKEFMPGVPRFNIGIGVILALFNLAVVAEVEYWFKCKKGWLAGFLMVPSAVFAYAMVLFFFAYGRASNAQQEYEWSLLTRVIYDLEESGFAEGVGKVSFIGAIQSSPLLINSSNKFPLLNRLVPRHIKDDWWWGHKQLTFHGMPAKYEKLDPQAKAEIISGEVPALVKRKDYAIYSWHDSFVIEFF